MTISLPHTLGALATGLLLLSSCKKDNDGNTPTVTYEQVGDMKVAGITGFAANGDMLAVDEDRRPVRWRSGSQDWIRLGTNTAVASNRNIIATCDDPQGNYYGVCIGYGAYVLPAGATLWQPLALPDAGKIDGATVYNAPIGNLNGDVVVQARCQLASGVRERIYRKAAAATTWMMLNDRPRDPATDPLQLVQFASSGDVFLEHVNVASQPPVVLKNGSSTLAEVTACAGQLVLPYCSFQYVISPGGDIMFSQGGSGSRKMYRMSAPGSYPGAAEYVYDLPQEGCNLYNKSLLRDGTMLGTANDCAYGEFFLFIRKAGATQWYKAPSLPGYVSAQVRSSPQGQVYTTSQPSATKGNFVYQIKF